MPSHGQVELVRANTHTIVLDNYEGLPALFHSDIYSGGLGIQGIFNQFLDHA